MASRIDQRKQIRTANQAGRAAAQLTAHLATTAAEDIRLAVSDTEPTNVPRRAVELLIEALEAIGAGQDPCVLPGSRLLSITETAALLGTSLQHVAQLLDDDVITSRGVGDRRHVDLRDALAYSETTTRTASNASGTSPHSGSATGFEGSGHI